MKEKILLIDFDGVIVDTFDLGMSVNNKLGTGISPDEYRKQFEGNVYENYDDNDEEIVSEDNEWFKLYTPGMLKLEPVEGVVEAIKTLGEKYTLIIISSNINSPIKKYLEKHALVSCFDEVFGADVHKSKVKKIKMVFEKHGVEAKDCLFITDSLGDIREANKMNVDSIGVTWGWHSRETLEKGSPFTIVDKTSEIVPAVDKYFRED